MIKIKDGKQRERKIIRQGDLLITDNGDYLQVVQISSSTFKLIEISSANRYSDGVVFDIIDNSITLADIQEKLMEESDTKIVQHIPYNEYSLYLEF